MKPIETLSKALDILEICLTRAGPVSVAELSELTGINISAVYRIVATLTSRGYITQQQRGLYLLGPRLTFHDRNLEITRLREIAVPMLKKLGTDVNESTNMGVLSGNEAINSAIILSDQRLQIVTRDGESVPFHCTAVGKVFLAHMNRARMENILRSQGLRAYTENTITDIKVLRRELARVRQDGVAYDNEEHELGLRNGVAPVRNGDGRVIAAVGVIGPTARLTREKMVALAPKIKKCADEVSWQLGYKGGRSP